MKRVASALLLSVLLVFGTSPRAFAYSFSPSGSYIASGPFQIVIGTSTMNCLAVMNFDVGTDGFAVITKMRYNGDPLGICQLIDTMSLPQQLKATGMGEAQASFFLSTPIGNCGPMVVNFSVPSSPMAFRSSPTPTLCSIAANLQVVMSPLQIVP